VDAVEVDHRRTDSPAELHPAVRAALASPGTDRRSPTGGATVRAWLARRVIKWLYPHESGVGEGAALRGAGYGFAFEARVQGSNPELTPDARRAYKRAESSFRRLGHGLVSDDEAIGGSRG
jgi:hypothetical protein